MPKTFPILIDVEEIAVGRVMRVLNKMPGVSKLHLDLQEKKQAKANGASRPATGRVNLAHSGNDTALAALYRKSPQTTGDLRAFFVAEGRSPHSINSVMHNLKRAGDVKSTTDGWILSKKARDRLRGRERYEKSQAKK